MDIAGQDAILTVRAGSSSEQREAHMHGIAKQLRGQTERSVSRLEERTGLFCTEWKTKYEDALGSCNRRPGASWLNVQRKHPVACLDYVILHELALCRGPGLVRGGAERYIPWLADAQRAQQRPAGLRWLGAQYGTTEDYDDAVHRRRAQRSPHLPLHALNHGDRLRAQTLLSRAKQIADLPLRGIHYLVATAVRFRLYVESRHSRVSHDSTQRQKDFWNKGILFLSDDINHSRSIAVVRLKEMRPHRSATQWRTKVDPRFVIDQYQKPTTEQIYEEIAFVMGTFGYQIEDSDDAQPTMSCSTSRRGVRAWRIPATFVAILDSSPIG